MSVITTFAFHHIFLTPRTSRECVSIFAQDTIQQSVAPKLTATWGVETDKDGTRRLVRRWFTNEIRSNPPKP